MIMQDDLRVLMVDDDRELCEEFGRCFAETDGITLSSATGSVTDALTRVREDEPDAVILDLELHKGAGNGLMFLQRLSEMDEIRKPYILVCTNNSSRKTYDAANQLGADFIMYKHQEGFCPQEVAEFLLAVGSGRRAQTSPVPSVGQQETHHASAERKARIYDELNRVAINPRNKGYHYLADAIELLCEGRTSNVSALIGKKYDKTKESVERAMQNAIHKAWSTADINDLLENYKAFISPRRDSPTVTEFISYYAAKIQNNG